MKLDLSLLKDLMACASVTADVVACNRASARMLEWLQAHGLHCIVESCDGRNVVYASVKPNDTCPDVLFNAHLDVVPVSSPSLHELRMDGNILLRGRGTNDCLGNAVVIAEILSQLPKECSAGAFFTLDEEVGGQTTAAMVQRGYTAQKIVIIIDGSPYVINSGQKGILSLELTAHASGGHASEPWRHTNAIEALLDGYAKLKSTWSNPTEDNQWQTSSAPTILSAGQVENAIPSTARMILNCRYIDTAEAQKPPVRALQRQSALLARALAHKHHHALAVERWHDSGGDKRRIRQLHAAPFARLTVRGTARDDSPQQRHALGERPAEGGVLALP